MTKQQIRKTIRKEKRRLTQDVITAASASFAQLADAICTTYAPKTVLLYASLPDEVPTLAYIESMGCQCVLPCVVDDANMELRLFTCPDDLVVTEPYGIPEPTGPLFTDYSAIDIAFIPGMAFDDEGHRLGRGKGYYDRLLAHPAFSQIPKIGVCYDFQLLPSVPFEPHDCLMDSVLVVPCQSEA